MATKQNKIELNAQKRVAIGKGLNGIRNAGFLPAVLYGKKQEAVPLQITVKDFKRAFELAGESTLIYLNVDGQVYPTIIHDIAKDSVSDNIIHADFYKVRLDEKIKAMVAVAFEGESPAVKDLAGIFVRNINELEVEAFPQDLPHEIKVDISALNNFGDQILIKDIKLSPELKLMAKEDDIVATVKEPISEEQLQAELEAPSATVEDVEVIKKEKKEEEPAEESAPAPEAK